MSALRCLILAVAISVAGADASACEPCLTKSPLDRTIQMASVIALVTNKDQNSAASLETGPELVELTVNKIYKGQVEGSTVLVHSWYGQCVFGVHMQLNAQAIVMLQEMMDVSTGYWDGTYKVVEGGCSEGQIDVKYGTVTANDKHMSLDSFVSKYLQ